MRVKKVVDEDFVNYKHPAMFIGSISCGGKCCIENGLPLSVCQNDAWRDGATVVIDVDDLVRRYLANDMTKAVVWGGLEPFEQFDDVYSFVKTLRYVYKCNDDVVIYTGYYRNEIENMVSALESFGNIVIKWGRYIPNMPHRYDAVLGVELASDNQFAERI